MQREAYERAGLEAHALAVPRDKNPYMRSPGAAFFDSADRERMGMLADHWWRGWDSCGPATGRRHNGLTRTERQRP